MTNHKLDMIFTNFFQRDVGNEEDIFDLGGNSLTAVQLVSEVNRLFSVDINMERFFQTPCKQTILDQLQGSKPAHTV